ncbi:MAG: VCBS repeat-containing protein [Saprospiraceae bacterium]|nr:VCBS repeat-containing protein [Saprospiraceae bacterium]
MKRKVALVTSGLLLAPMIGTSQSFNLRCDHPARDIAGNSRATMSFVDLDGDNDEDLIIWGSADAPTLAAAEAVQYFENTGNAFEEKSFSAFPNDLGMAELLDTSFSVDLHGSFTDFDKDGDFDVFIGADVGELRFLRNDDGTYISVDGDEDPFGAVEFGENVRPAMGDLDGDGDIDAVVGTAGGVKIYSNEDGKFGDAVTLSGELEDGSPLLYDFDGDGDLDLLVGNKYDDLLYFVNNEGVFTASNDIPVVGVEYEGYNAIAFADIDFDGDLEFLVGEGNGTIQVFEQNEAGDFSIVLYNPLNISDTEGYTAPAFVDFDEDGDLDLFVGQSEHMFYFENENGTFIPAEEKNPFAAYEGTYLRPTFADFDNDGDLDLIVGNDDRIDLFRKEAVGYEMETDTLQNPFYGLVEADQLAPALFDGDGDGDLDLVLGHKYGDLFYFVNNEGVFEEANENPFENFTAGSYSTPVFTDLDGDGDFDLVVGQGDGSVLGFENDNGVFTSLGNPFDFNFRSEAVPAFGDIDGDGDDDALVGTGPGMIFYLENSGTVKVDDRPDQSLLTNIFPNPVDKELSIDARWVTGNANLAILDIQGKIILQKEIRGSNHQIDVSNLRAGNYFIKISNSTGRAIKPFYRMD